MRRSCTQTTENVAGDNAPNDDLTTTTPGSTYSVRSGEIANVVRSELHALSIILKPVNYSHVHAH